MRSDWFKTKRKTDDDNQQERSAPKKRRLGNSGKDKKYSNNTERLANSTKPSTVMFIPWTKKGLLAKRMRELEERMVRMTGFRVKFVEAGGLPLWRQFSTDLSKGKDCGRDSCSTCSQGDENRLNCFQRSVVYESSCELCNPPDGKVTKDERMMISGKRTYIGETSRSIFERASQTWK